MLDLIDVLGVRKPGKHLELILIFGKPFPIDPYSLVWHIILLKEGTSTGECHCHEELYLVNNDVQVGGRHT